MSDLVLCSSHVVPRPLPDIGVHVRPATMDDIPFMDALQKLHTKQVGWMPTATFEGKIRAGQVLIAEEVGSGWLVVGSKEDASTTNHPLPTTNSPVGYCIAQDQYFKRDDVGVIYQMNVLPGRQRGLIGATLLKAQFERSAYGCKLYCCWRAQDIAANKFWEAMGFVPLAFRAGSEKKARIHIFWQKRIRAGDVSTPWWFPSKTNGGSIREDRIVLPIPPGTHWSDAKPMILPEAPDALPDRRAGCNPADVAATKTAGLHPALRKKRDATPVEAPKRVKRNGLMFDIPQPGEALPETTIVKAPKAPKEKPVRVKRKADPRLASAARELRDRWLEQVNASAPALPSGKYDVSRALDASMTIEVQPLKLFDAA